MIIQAPLNQQSAKEIDEYIDLGANEFYFGYSNEIELSSEVLSRRTGYHANFSSLEAIKQTVDKIKKRNKKIFVAINEHFYPEKYFGPIIRDIKYFIDIEVNGFIITDINLLIKLRIRFPGIFIIASTGAHILNSWSLRFFMNMGVKRFILPRSLSISEILELIAQNRGTEFEVFIMNEKCPNIDGFCCYVHGKFGSQYFGQPCTLLKLEKSCKEKYNGFGHYSCGACALYYLKDIPGIILKIVGRDNRLNKKIKYDIVYIKNSIDSLRGTNNFLEYADICQKRYMQIYGTPCNHNCYY
jgi:putative protease